MPLPVALQTRLAKRGILKHLEPGERTKRREAYHVPGLTGTLLWILHLISSMGLLCTKHWGGMSIEFSRQEY